VRNRWRSVCRASETNGPNLIEDVRPVPEEEKSGSERRQHARFDLLVDVSLSLRAQTATLTVLNISAGGVLLRNDQDVEFVVGEPIRVEFDAPELAAAFSIEAKVIRVVGATSRAGAVAAMWTSSDPQSTAGLAQVLWSLSNRK
jgi:hypothetical protein